MINTIRWLVALTLGVCVCGGQLGAQEVSFQGRTIQMLSGFPAGSSRDSHFRLIAPYFGKYLPGEPTVVVQNMTAAAGLKAANYLFGNGPHDGTMVSQYIRVMSRFILDDPGVKFSLEDMPILGLSPSTRILVMSSSAGSHSLEDLLRNGSNLNEIKVGTSVRGGLAHLQIKSLLNEFGVIPYRYVWGYRGSSNVLRAVRGSEVAMGVVDAGSYLSRSAATSGGDAVIWACQFGFLMPSGEVLLDETVDLRPCHEIVEKVQPAVLKSPEYRRLKAAALGFGTVTGSYVLPPSTSEAVVRSWTVAVAKTYADPAFQAAARRAGASTILIPPETARELIRQVKASDVKDVLLSLRKK